MLERADKNADGVLDFTEFVEWLCECRVEERWEEFARQSFAVESMLLLFYKARGFTVQVESLLGTVPELPVPDPLQSLDLVELMEATELSPDPIQQALKFREIAAFAKRTAGNCLGLIDSVVRYREKLWKSTEGHRQILGLETNETHSESLVLAGAGQVFGIRLSLEGALNLVNIHRKVVYALHGINHLFKKLRHCSVAFIGSLQKAKIVDTFILSWQVPMPVRNLHISRNSWVTTAGKALASGYVECIASGYAWCIASGYLLIIIIIIISISIIIITIIIIIPLTNPKCLSQVIRQEEWCFPCCPLWCFPCCPKWASKVWGVCDLWMLPEVMRLVLP